MASNITCGMVSFLDHYLVSIYFTASSICQCKANCKNFSTHQIALYSIKEYNQKLYHFPGFPKNDVNLVVLSMQYIDFTFKK